MPSWPCACRTPAPRAWRRRSVNSWPFCSGLVGLSVQNPFLLLIALFVWIGAEAEAVRVEEKVLLKDARVREAMLTEFHTVAPVRLVGIRRRFAPRRHTARLPRPNDRRRGLRRSTHDDRT